VDLDVAGSNPVTRPKPSPDPNIRLSRRCEPRVRRSNLQNWDDFLEKERP
jgi:hypothetical protein